MIFVVIFRSCDKAAEQQTPPVFVESTLLQKLILRYSKYVNGVWELMARFDFLVRLLVYAFVPVFPIFALHPLEVLVKVGEPLQDGLPVHAVWVRAVEYVAQHPKQGAIDFRWLIAEKELLLCTQEVGQSL